MVLATRVDRLETSRTGADVDPLDEAVLAQLLERAVDAGDPDRAPICSQLVEDLLGGQTTILAAEQLDDRPPGAAVSVPPGVQGGNRRLRPGIRHGAKW